MKAKKVIGRRTWLLDGTIITGWPETIDDGLLIKIIYYSDATKQVQMGMEWYFEAPHHSGGIIMATAPQSETKADILKRYPDAHIIRGKWAPDPYFWEVHDGAMASTWGKDGD